MGKGRGKGQSSSSFRDILFQVTMEKLEELKGQRDRLKDHFTSLLERVETLEEPLDKLKELHDGMKSSPVDLDKEFTPKLKNLGVFLKGADPSISSDLIQNWIQTLRTEMDYSLKRCEYSYLFGSILNEWFNSEGGASTEEEVKEGEEGEVKCSDAENRDKTIEELSERIFKDPGPFNSEAFDELLNQLFTFDNPEHQELIWRMKKVLKQFGEDFKNQEVSHYDVSCCINGLLSADSMNEDKRRTLKELQQNSQAVEEIATLLTNRLRNYERWSWPEGGVFVDVRRNISGRYRAFLDEDLITALFLQFVGVQWSAQIKAQLKKIHESKIWIRPQKYKPQSVEALRQTTLKSAFLSLVPNSMEDQSVGYESPDIANTRGMQMEMAYDSVAYGGAAAVPINCHSKRSICPPPQQANPLNIKAQMLHLVSGEIKLNQVLRPDSNFTIVCSDLEWFGPSLVHDAILRLLSFWGVPATWCAFFKSFLSTPMKFTKDGEPQLRLRGVPISHALSTLFGESVLFLMDMIVNKKTGINLFRVYDDFWFWHHESSKVQIAWQEMTNFVNLVGLAFNEEKSGSLTTFNPEVIAQMKAESGASHIVRFGELPLPQKTIRWGFIELHSDGVFRLDQASLSKFIGEMVDLLGRSKNVMSWVSTYNRYMSFFVRCFGKPALVFGLQHLSQIERSLNEIRIQAFGDASPTGNPLPILTSKFDIFGILGTDDERVLDGWAYWPMSRGGLGLKNPLIDIMATREAYEEYGKRQEEAPGDSAFQSMIKRDRNVWDKYMAGELCNQHEYDLDPPEDEPSCGGPAPLPTPQPYGFQIMDNVGGPRRVMPTINGGVKRKITFEEFCQRRETGLVHWYQKFVELMQNPSPSGPNLSSEMMSRSNENDLLENEEKWLFALYGGQLEGHFGSLKFIDTKLIPMSMINSIKSSKLKY